MSLFSECASDDTTIRLCKSLCAYALLLLWRAIDAATFGEMRSKNIFRLTGYLCNQLQRLSDSKKWKCNMYFHSLTEKCRYSLHCTEYPYIAPALMCSFFDSRLVNFILSVGIILRGRTCPSCAFSRTELFWRKRQMVATCAGLTAWLIAICVFVCIERCTSHCKIYLGISSAHTQHHQHDEMQSRSDFKISNRRKKKKRKSMKIENLILGCRLFKFNLSQICYAR